MEAPSEFQEHLRVLEERLLDPEVRGSRHQLESLLANDFVEFGSSGRVYDKTKMIPMSQPVTAS